MARRKVVRISATLIAELLTGKGFDDHSLYRLDGLPDNSRVVGMHVNFERDTFELLLESQEFEDTEPGGLYPELQLTITRAIPRIAEDGSMVFLPWPEREGSKVQ